VEEPASVLLWLATFDNARLERPAARLVSENAADSKPAVAVTV
jgi:hypothetical protein